MGSDVRTLGCCNSSERATVYLDPALHRALRLKSIETSRSVSDLINDAVWEGMAEDAEDFAAFEARKNESAVTFEGFVKELKRDGKM